MAKILIATTSFGTYDPENVHLLRRSGLEIVLNPTGKTLSPEEIVRYAAGCAGIIAGTERYDSKTLQKLQGLQAISRCGAGLDSIDLPEAERLGIRVLSTPYGPTQAVAELTIAFILSLIRNIPISDAQLKAGSWEKPMGFLLGELKFGILGLGKIGHCVAAILRRFEATVMAYDIQPDRPWAMAHNVALRDRDTVLRESDVLCLHLPYEKDLHHLIGENEIAKMKPGSFLINASRGGLIDEEALYKALKSSHLRGAALDTFEKEPYQGPLRELKNVILTPHIGSYARAGRIAMERESAENLIKVMKP